MQGIVSNLILFVGCVFFSLLQLQNAVCISQVFPILSRRCYFLLWGESKWILWFHWIFFLLRFWCRSESYIHYVVYIQMCVRSRRKKFSGHSWNNHHAFVIMRVALGRSLIRRELKCIISVSSSIWVWWMHVCSGMERGASGNERMNNVHFRDSTKSLQWPLRTACLNWCLYLDRCITLSSCALQLYLPKPYLWHHRVICLVHLSHVLRVLEWSCRLNPLLLWKCDLSLNGMLA